MTRKTKRVLKHIGIILLLALMVVLLLAGVGPASADEPGGRQGPALSPQPRSPAAGTEGRWVWQNPLPTGEPLYSVTFVDSQTGWAVGRRGTVIKTTDGGATWTSQISGTFSWLFSVKFLDAQTGWAVGNGGTILKTTNGGATWTPQASGTTQWLSSVAFVDASTGWAVGWYGTILRYAPFTNAVVLPLVLKGYAAGW